MHTTAHTTQRAYKPIYKPKGSVMTGPKKNASGKKQKELVGPRVISSRFGEVTVDLEKRINFPFGIVGLPQSLNFIITDMPQKSGSRFKLLQSLEDETFSFVVLPVDLQNSFIEKEDLTEMCDALNIAQENLLILLITSVRKNLDGTSSVSINARAPIAIDSQDKAGIQYVFPHNKYEICTPLTLTKKE